MPTNIIEHNIIEHNIIEHNIIEHNIIPFIMVSQILVISGLLLFTTISCIYIFLLELTWLMVITYCNEKMNFIRDNIRQNNIINIEIGIPIVNVIWTKHWEDENIQLINTFDSEYLHFLNNNFHVIDNYNNIKPTIGTLLSEY